MVETQIVSRGVRDPRVLAAMREVPRHLFVEPSQQARAYDDTPLPIAGHQTISQPYIVALMTELLDLTPNEKVLEIGTGSGYQSAVLSRVCKQVYSIEIVPELARSAAERLKSLGYDNVIVREGDGYRGWPEEAPFDAIIVTAAPERMPAAAARPARAQRAPGHPGRRLLPGAQGLPEGRGGRRDRAGDPARALRSDDRRGREDPDASGQLIARPTA